DEGKRGGGRWQRTAGRRGAYLRGVHAPVDGRDRREGQGCSEDQRPAGIVHGGCLGSGCGRNSSGNNGLNDERDRRWPAPLDWITGRRQWLPAVEILRWKSYSPAGQNDAMRSAEGPG